jgi:DNA-binding NarL/FixJ family response regulator
LREQRKAIVVETRSAPTSILTAFPEPIISHGISALIGSFGEKYRLVGQASDGVEAEKLAATLHPDVILMGLRLPRQSGIETTKNIKAEYPEIQIIVLSFLNDIADINAAMQAGASGFLLKTVREEELIKAIDTVMSGEAVFSPEIAKNLLAILRRPSQELSALTERETQILRMVALGATNKKIAQDMSLSVRTVETHIANIFTKLGVTTRTEAVTTAIRKHLIVIS